MNLAILPLTMALLTGSSVIEAVGLQAAATPVVDGSAHEAKLRIVNDLLAAVASGQAQGLNEFIEANASIRGPANDQVIDATLANMQDLVRRCRFIPEWNLRFSSRSLSVGMRCNLAGRRDTLYLAEFGFQGTKINAIRVWAVVQEVPPQ